MADTSSSPSGTGRVPMSLIQLLRQMSKSRYEAFTCRVPVARLQEGPSCSSSAPSSSASSHPRRKRRNAVQPTQSAAARLLSATSPSEMEAQANNVMRLVFSSLTSFSDVAHRGQHVTTLFDAFVAAAAQLPMTAIPSEHLLVRIANRLQSLATKYSSFLIHARVILLEHPTILKPLIKTHLGLVGLASYSSKTNHVAGARRSFRSSLSGAPEALTRLYLTALPTEPHVFSFGLLTEVVSGSPNLRQESGAALIQQFTDLVLYASKCLPESLHSFCAPWLASLAPDQLESLVAVVGRSLKRNPETSLWHTALTLKHANLVTVPGFVTAHLLPSCYQAFETFSVQLHSFARTLLEQFAVSITQLDTLQQAIQFVGTGSPSNQKLKTALMTALAKAMPAQDVSSLVPLGISTACAFSQAQATLDDRLSCVPLLCSWIRRASLGPSPADVSGALALLADWMGASADAMLPAVSKSFPEGLTGVPGSFVAKLAQVIANNQAPLKVGTLLHAVRVVSSLGKWSQFSEQSKNIWIPDLLHRHTQEDMIALANISYSALLSDSPDPLVFEILARLLCHSDRLVTSAVVSVLRRLAATPGSTPVHRVLDELFARLLKYIYLGNGAPTLSTGVTERVLGVLSCDAVLAISSESFTSLLVILHHPALVASPPSLHQHLRPSFTNWHRLAHKLGKASLFSTLSDLLVADSVIKHVFSLFEQHPTCTALRQSLQATLTTLSANCDPEFLPHLITSHLQAFSDQLRNTAGQLPADTAQICRLPKGVLYDPKSAQAAASSSRSGKQLTEEERWEQEALARKTAPVQYTAEQKALLESQDEVRKRVELLVAQSSFFFSLLSDIAIGAPLSISQHFTVLIPLLGRLLPSPYLFFQSSFLLPCLATLFAAVPGPFRRHAELVAVLTYRLCTHPSSSDIDQVGDAATRSLLFALFGTLNNKPEQISGRALALLVPVIDFALSLNDEDAATYSRSSPASSSSSSAAESEGEAQQSPLHLAHHTILALLHSVVAQFSLGDISVCWNDAVRILLRLHERYPPSRVTARAALIVCAEALLNMTEFIDGLVSTNGSIREVCLEGLLATRYFNGRSRLVVRPRLPLCAIPRFIIALYDTHERNAELAQTLSSRFIYDIDLVHVEELYAQLHNPSADVRQMAALALVNSLPSLGSRLPAPVLLDKAISIYSANLPPAAPKKANMAQLPVKIPQAVLDAKSYPRSGAVQLITAASPSLAAEDVQRAFSFLIKTAVLDPHPDTFDFVLSAGQLLSRDHHQAHLTWLLQSCDAGLSQAPDHGDFDQVREALVIFIGNLAQYLSPEDPRVQRILEQLVRMLETPSRSVQTSIAKLLGPLLLRLNQNKALIQSFFTSLFDKLKANSPVVRNGAALGIAGAIYGLGTPTLSNFDVHPRLMAGLGKERALCHGALLTFAHLSNVLGASYDAFALKVLPNLIPSFSDSSSEIKDASLETAHTLMLNLSDYGANLALLPLLQGLHKTQSWRSRQGSIQLVSAMTSRSPRQLAACLPKIVPGLQEVIIDAHPVLQTESRNALMKIGAVIENPEIKPKIPALVAAISDPAKNLFVALEQLLQTVFVNTIDPASLALVMPVLLLGMHDRRSDVKCMAAQVAGGMSDLVDGRTLIPYLPILSETLRRILLDSIPVVRATASFAFGTLIRGLGVERFPGLYQWLIQTMYSELGSVERDGAAQGLSQYYGAIPLASFRAEFARFLGDTRDPNASIREGSLGLLSYLPLSMRGAFEEFLPQALPCMLEGLSDVSEAVRGVSLRAAKGLISQYAGSSLAVLLPALEESMFHLNWRIRQSCIQLTGDLIQQILDGEDARAVRASNDRIAPELILNELIGRSQRNSLLAALAMCRQDMSKQVAQRAMQVWKDCVSHSTRALREIVPILMQRIVSCLGSPSSELQSLATNTLAMLVVKLDESILTNIFPLLQEALEDSSAASAGVRQGACLGLCALMESASRPQVSTYMSSIVPCINRALCDEVPVVREAAAHAFDVLCNRAGADVLDDIIPPLLEELEDPEKKASALETFKQLVIVRSNLILPRLVPRLLATPFTPFNAGALATLAEVSGPTLYPHLAQILSTIIPLFSSDAGFEAPVTSILRSLRDDGVPPFFNELNRLCTSEDVPTQLGTIELWRLFAQTTQCDWEMYVPSTIRNLLSFISEDNVELQTAALKSLIGLEKSLPKDTKLNYVHCLRDFFTEHLQSNPRIEGFAHPKALDSVLPILNAALLNGSTEQRIEAAYGLEQVIKLTPAKALGPYLLPISGPLLRVLGSRFPTPLKEAIFETFNTFLAKATTILRPLESQLRTTYLKALRDLAPSVRELGATGLGLLMSIITRVDPLVVDIISALRDPTVGEASSELQSGLLMALRNVLKEAGSQTTPKIREQLPPVLLPLLQNSAVRCLSADCLSYLLIASPAPERATLFECISRPAPGQELPRCVLLCSMLCRCPTLVTSVLSEHALEKQTLAALLHSDDATALMGVGLLHSALFRAATTATSPLAPSSSSSSSSSSAAAAAEVAPVVSLSPYLAVIQQILRSRTDPLKLAVLDTLKRAMKSDGAVCMLLSKELAPILMELIKDRKSLPIKMAAERALLHLLQLRTDRSKFAAHMALLSPADVRNITDYVKRVLVKVAQANSDDEAPQDPENPLARFTLDRS